ncbi:pilus assembly protein PilV [Roseateles sp. DC23W]|uniref:Pilus assembly protein PilV n=1 Tax=Pelomonas dachongensis TaxID=3299029 RepID=A0ABW7ERS8_9BURK
MKLHPAVRAGRRSRSTGFAMLEALVALLICSLGILGVVGLQGSMTRAQTSATFRAEAAFLSQQLIGVMWNDRANLSQYATASCRTACTDWQARVAARLPNGASTVTVTPAGVVTIQIRWTQPGESTNRFSTAVSIN